MAFGYYASITVDNTKVGGSSGSLTDFPVLVSGTYDGTGGEPDLRVAGSGGNVQNANGYDIYFYDDENLTTKYDHEIVYYDGTTGQYIAWVRVPTLNKGSDTTLYVHYGDSGISADPSATTTWSSSIYTGVYHLKEDPSGSAPQMYDSTGGAHDGTSGGNMTSEDSVAGQIHKALDFDGNTTSGESDYINASGLFSTISNLAVFSVTAWFRLDAYQTSGTVLWGRNGSAAWYGYVFTNGNFRFSINSTNFKDSSGNEISLSTWYLIQAVKVSATAVKVYLNNTTIIDTSMTSSNTDTATDSVNIGTYNSGELNSFPTNGKMEEFRLAKVALEADWHTTEYNNQNSPSTFYSVGSETAVGGSGRTAVSSRSAAGARTDSGSRTAASSRTAV